MNTDTSNTEKDSISNTFTVSKRTIIEESVNHGKDRRKLSKKKMLRSSNKRRLSGGADVESSAADRVSLKPESEEIQQEASTDFVSTPEAPSGNSNPNIKEPLMTTGDARVDEMLECVLLNLDEAGKALASLGENLEHDLKLFLVELMSKLRKWTSHVDNKVEWTRRDIVVLHKELANRISALDETRRESADLKIKLEQSEAAKFMAQKSVTETMTSSHPQKNVEKFEKSDTVVEGNVQGDPSIYGNSKAPSQVRSVQIGATIEQSLASQSDNREIQQMADAPESISTFRAEEERLKNCCAELEAEILELRKENEKIVKERAEYENAIQRALLKGVSSLNVEALKVLRCTPIPNCCSPCPPTTTIEPMAKSTRDCAAPSATKSPSIVNQCKNNGSREVLNSTSGKRNCQSAGNSERKSRKSRDNNMLLLLHQKDAENFGIQTNSNNCENSTKKSSFCTGGNCGKYGKIC